MRMTKLDMLSVVMLVKGQSRKLIGRMVQQEVDEHKNNIIMVEVIQDEREAMASIRKLGSRSDRLRWLKWRQCNEAHKKVYISSICEREDAVEQIYTN